MNRPLILDNCVNRIGDDKKMFTYDYNSDLNIVQLGSNSIPFIDLKESSCELSTKTRVERERDDMDFHLSELLTKSEISRERDDEINVFLELETKSFVKRERDDDDFNYY